MPYPPSGTELVDGAVIKPSHIADTITELGPDPSGTYADLTARLTAIESLLLPSGSSARLMPSGGSTGQQLAKTSGTSYATSWADTHPVPPGGTSGQALTKSSATDYAAGWADIPTPPTPPIDPRLGVRLAWENDSQIYNNSTAEATTLTFNIPGQGNPGGNKWILTTHGLLTNNSGASANFSVRCKLSAPGLTIATQLSATTLAIPAGGTLERPYQVIWELMGDNDWNLNQLARFKVGGLMTVPDTTADAFNQTGYRRGNTIGQPQWAGPIVLTVTAQWSVAATTIQTEMHGWDVIWYGTSPG